MKTILPQLGQCSQISVPAMRIVHVQLLTLKKRENIPVKQNSDGAKALCCKHAIITYMAQGSTIYRCDLICSIRQKTVQKMFSATL